MSPRVRALLRAAALLVAAAALVLLYLRPARWVPAERAAVLLLTPGAEAASPPAGFAGLATLESAPPAARPAEAAVFADAGALWRRRPEIARLAVAGHGLRAFEWQGYTGRVEPLPPPPLPRGVADVLWRRRLDLGEPLVVEGRLSGVSGRRGRLALRGPGGEEDALPLGGDASVAGAGGQARFALRARPRLAGAHLYELQLLSGEEVLRRESIDVEVVAPPPLRLLLLEESPSFETRGLERLLRARGAIYALRTRLSRDRYREVFHGRPPAPLRLSAALLAEVDVVLLDAPALAALAGGERDALRRALADGLGVLVLPRAGLGPWEVEDLDGVDDWGARAVVGGETLAVAARWPGMPAAPPLPVPARELRPGAAVEPLVEDASGRLLAAARPRGRGRAAVALLTDTYRWALAGEAEVHAAYWAHLLGAVARARGGPRWEVAAGPIVAGEPLAVALAGAGEAPLATWRPPESDPEPLALRQDPFDAERFTAAVWPRPGWQRLEAGEAAADFYAAPAGAWPALDAARRQRETALRALHGDEPAGARPPRVRRDLPRWPFYALFLVAVACLWVEERLRAGW